MHSFEVLTDPREDQLPERRVREIVLDGLAVCGVSAAISTAFAVTVTLLAKLLG
jgi:hypothetical protein